MGNRVGRIEGELPDPLLMDLTAAAIAGLVDATSIRWISITDDTRWMGRNAVSTTQE
jgi:hypothetical protein